MLANGAFVFEAIVCASAVWFAARLLTDENERQANDPDRGILWLTAWEVGFVTTSFCAVYTLYRWFLMRPVNWVIIFTLVATMLFTIVTVLRRAGKRDQMNGRPSERR